MASKDKAIAQLEATLAAERKRAEQASNAAAAVELQAASKRSVAASTQAALAEARREAQQLRNQA